MAKFYNDEKGWVVMEMSLCDIHSLVACSDWTKVWAEEETGLDDVCVDVITVDPKDVEEMNEGQREGVVEFMKEVNRLHTELMELDTKFHDLFGCR